MSADETNPKDLIGVTKPPLHLVPAALLIHTSQAMANGAKKYGAYNWRQRRVKASIYIAAAMRHIASYYDGEETARDSGVHHLAHAAACFAIILDAKETGNLIDDRPTTGAAADLIDQMTLSPPSPRTTVSTRPLEITVDESALDTAASKIKPVWEEP